MHRPPRTVSCIMENAAPENSFRTVVSTYEVKEDKRCGTYMLPRLCNHCANPPASPSVPWAPLSSARMASSSSMATAAWAAPTACRPAL
jgi:hypothetical protein